MVTDTFLVPKPKNISHAEAASIPLVGLTALQSFDKVKGGVEGKTVFVTAGRKFLNPKNRYGNQSNAPMWSWWGRIVSMPNC